MTKALSPALNCHVQQPSVWKIASVLTVGLVAYSSGAIFIRLAICDNQTPTVGFSFFLAASRMLIAMVCCIPAWRGFSRANYSRRDLWASFVAGIALALYFATWITSLNFTSIAVSTTLVNLNPLWVLLISWLWLRHKPTTLTLWGIGIAILGATLISGAAASPQLGGGASVSVGNGLALIGSFSIAAYILLGHTAQQAKISSQHHMVLVYSTAALVLIPTPLLLHTHYTGHTWRAYSWMVLMALITQMLGHTCLNWLMKWVKPTLLSAVLLMEPIVASGLGYLTFKTIPSVGVLIGGVIVILGVAIAVLYQRSILPNKTHS